MNDFLNYMWVLVVFFAGGALGWLGRDAEKHSDKTIAGKILFFFLASFTSMFLGWISFEFAFAYFEKVGISAAFGGLVSYYGTKALEKFEELLIYYIKNRIER